MTLLNGALEARGKVLLKLNVTADKRDAVLAVLPAAKSPTVNQLANGDYAIESVVPKAGINLVIPALTEAGATDLLEIPILQDRPLMTGSGTVTEFDDGEGARHGHGGRRPRVPVPLHRDRRRHAHDRRSGQQVRFEPLPKFGHFQAGRVARSDGSWRSPTPATSVSGGSST